MLLSVVIPHYNIPKELLTACIDSITGQGIPDDSYEIIIIDDESEEFPEWVCEKYSRQNIRLIRNPHGGPGAARNRGIDEAKGRYIQFVDADDYLLQNGQQKQCLAILEERRPQILRFAYRIRRGGKEEQTHDKKTVKFKSITSGAEFMRDNKIGRAHV